MVIPILLSCDIALGLLGIVLFIFGEE